MDEEYLDIPGYKDAKCCGTCKWGNPSHSARHVECIEYMEMVEHTKVCDSHKFNVVPLRRDK